MDRGCWFGAWLQHSGPIWILPLPSSCVTRVTFKTLNNQWDSQRPIRTDPALNTRYSQMCVPAEDSGIISTARGLGFSICSMDTMILIIPRYRAVVETKVVIGCEGLRNQCLAHRRHARVSFITGPVSDSVTQGDRHS